MQTARWLTIGLLTHDLGGTILLQRGGEHLHPYAVRLGVGVGVGVGLGLGLGTWTWTCEMRCTCACGALRGEHLGCRGGASVHEDVRRPPRVRVPPRLEGEHRRCRRGKAREVCEVRGRERDAQVLQRRCGLRGANCEGRVGHARARGGARGEVGGSRGGTTRLGRGSSVRRAVGSSGAQHTGFACAVDCGDHRHVRRQEELRHGDARREVASQVAT